MSIAVTFYAPAGLDLVVYFRPRGEDQDLLDEEGSAAVADTALPELYRAELTPPSGFVAGWHHAAVIPVGETEALLVGDVNLQDDGEDHRLGEEELDLDVIAASVTSGLLGSGAVIIDHHYGGTDALRVVNDAGAGVPRSTITAYLQSDYLAGNRSADFIRGQTTTDANGRWYAPLALDPETYSLVITKPLGYVAAVVTVVVEAS